MAPAQSSPLEEKEDEGPNTAHTGPDGKTGPGCVWGNDCTLRDDPNITNALFAPDSIGRISMRKILNKSTHVCRMYLVALRHFCMDLARAGPKHALAIENIEVIEVTFHQIRRVWRHQSLRITARLGEDRESPVHAWRTTLRTTGGD